MVRVGVKIANLRRDSAPIYSDTIPTGLVHKMPLYLPNRSRLHLVHFAEVVISLNEVHSRSIIINSAERLDIQKAGASRSP